MTIDVTRTSLFARYGHKLRIQQYPRCPPGGHLGFWAVLVFQMDFLRGHKKWKRSTYYHQFGDLLPSSIKVLQTEQYRGRRALRRLAGDMFQGN
jgi:hypothetical protein